MYTMVSVYQLDALVAGNGSYIVRPCGHDLHGPTVPSHFITRICYFDQVLKLLLGTVTPQLS